MQSARRGYNDFRLPWAEFIRRLEERFHFTRLYIGGGNSKEVDISLLPANVTIVSNLNGLVGGIALWRDARLLSNTHMAAPDFHNGMASDDRTVGG